MLLLLLAFGQFVLIAASYSIVPEWFTLWRRPIRHHNYMRDLISRRFSRGQHYWRLPTITPTFCALFHATWIRRQLQITWLRQNTSPNKADRDLICRLRTRLDHVETPVVVISGAFKGEYFHCQFCGSTMNSSDEGWSFVRSWRDTISKWCSGILEVLWICWYTDLRTLVFANDKKLLFINRNARNALTFFLNSIRYSICVIYSRLRVVRDVSVQKKIFPRI